VPTRTISLALGRKYAGASDSFHLLNSLAQALSSTLDQGIAYDWSPLPEDLDPSYPSNIATWISTTNDGPLTPANVRFNFRIEHWRPPAIQSVSDFDQTWTSPASWPRFNLQLIRVAIGTNPTFAPGILKPGDYFAVRIRRRGNDILDTYPSAVNLSQSIEWTFQRRCQILCCP